MMTPRKMKPMTAMILIMPRTNSTGDVRSLSTDCDRDAERRILTFTIATDCKELHEYQEGQKHGDPDSDIDVVSPELDGDAGGGDLEREDDKPTEGILPSHGKAPN